MPDPDRLLRTVHKATQAFRATPHRRGRVVSLVDAAEVLVTGDLHGNVENFRCLLQRAKLAEHPNRHLVLQELVHGPFRYPTGGDKSHQTVDLLAALKCQFPGQVHFLVGNHELAQWTNRRIGKAEGDLNELFYRGVESAYGARAIEVYAAYVDLFMAAPLALRTPNRVFISHSLPSRARLPTFDLAVLETDEVDEASVVSGGVIHSLVWGRDTSAETAAEYLRRVDADWLISGHIPCDKGFEVPNDRQIILDSQDYPACYCLFPTDRPVTQAELVAGVGMLTD